MRGDGEKPVAFECTGLDDFFTQLEEQSNALAASCKEVIY